MVYNSKAVIVWIDDHFLTPTFEEDQNKNAWHKLFGTINSRLYRLLDIDINFLRTGKEAEEYLSQSNLFASNTYYYFIVDRKLPYDYGEDAVDSISEDIVNDLMEYKKKYECLDFSILSSGSPDSYAIKNLDYYLKPQNKEFTLPDELRHKILLNIKNNIGFINQEVEYATKINKPFGKTKELSQDSYTLYPFIDKFRSFVELEEIVKNDFETLIVLSKNSTSDKFIQQSLLIALYDNLSDYEGLNYYRQSDYGQLKEQGYYDEISELTEKIPVIRLETWSLDSYKAIFKLLKFRLSVVIISSDDDNISNYIDCSKKTRIIKVDGLDITNKDTAEIILFSLVNKLTNDSKLNYEASIYSQNPILFFHPIVYRLIADSQIHIAELDDPSETISEIYTYFKKLNLENSSVNRQRILDSKPIEFKTDYIYERCQYLLKERYNDFLVNTIKYWLKNSWNVNYNVKPSGQTTQEIWQKSSYILLKELFSKLDFEQLEPVDKKDFIEINNSMKIFDELCIVGEVQENISYKMVWPHEKYPINFHMQHMLSRNNNQKLYFQNSNFNFVDYSPELLQDYKLLENKINYYRDIFELIKNTKQYFPPVIQGTIEKISWRIQNKQQTFQENENEEFKKLSNIFLRIAIVFGEAVIGDKIKINETDKAGLGVLAGYYRDRVIKKENYDLFKVKQTSILCDDTYKEIDFVKKYGTILNNKNTLFKALSEDDDSLYDKNGKIKGFNAVDDDENEYLNRLLRADNLDYISQLSTISTTMLINEHNLKVLKYKDGYKLLAYLADTRNMWEHKHNDLWHNELFIRFFIYSFESIWLMQKYILEQLGETELVETKYITLNSEKNLSKIRFTTLDEYNEYFTKLYK